MAIEHAEHVHSASGWAATAPKIETRKPLPVIKPIMFLAAFVLVLMCSASAWIYSQGTHDLRVQAQGIATVSQGELEKAVQILLTQAQDLVLRITVGTAAGGTGLLLAVLIGVSWWRRRLLGRLIHTHQEWEDQSDRLKETSKQLQHQTNERQKAESELRLIRVEIDKRVEERTVRLSQTYSRLEAELNERKQAEKALAQQAQELGRSKDVLELHVQARTQELQKLQRRYEHILNSAGEGIYGLDLQGKATFVNPAAAKLTGWKVEELIGRAEHEIFHHQPPATAGTNNLVARDRNGEHLADKIFFRKDGTTFPAEYVRTPIMEKEKLVGAVVIFKDITERKRTEEALARKAAELARSNAELEQFAYVASHDLQEPLRKIQAFGDRLKAKCDAVQLQDGKDYLERMQNAAARMQRLINDLLTFSRVISTTEPFVPVDLGAVTKEVLTDLEVRLEQTKAKMEIGDLPVIDADPMQMRQLLQNLIGNALKFQAPNSQPVVKIQAQIIKSPFAGGADAAPMDEMCELTIQDNGIGFDEKYLDKIFAMFQRLHGRNEYEGTGVGLAVCRRITDRHSGTISARSKTGEGASFFVTLPVHQTKGEKVS